MSSQEDVYRSVYLSQEYLYISVRLSSTILVEVSIRTRILFNSKDTTNRIWITAVIRTFKEYKCTRHIRAKVGHEQIWLGGCLSGLGLPFASMKFNFEMEPLKKSCLAVMESAAREM